MSNEIRWISLKNNGAFVVSIRVKGGSESYNTGTFPVGQEKTVDLADIGGKVKDGDTVYLEAVVKAGKNKTASQRFTYRKNSNKNATYAIKGTTLSNTLSYNGTVDMFDKVSEPIRALSLKNNGGFAVSLRVKSDSSSYTTSSFPVGQEKTVDINEISDKIKDGDEIWLEAIVSLGNDNTAKQHFIYKKNSNKKAAFTIKGTTLSNSLSYNGTVDLFTKESEPIRAISLKNNGGFVVSLRVKSDSSSYTTSSFPVGQEKTVDINEISDKIKDGDEIWPEAIVSLGNDNTAKQHFIYKKNSNKKASYTISGTTLNNSLVYNGLDSLVPPISSTPIKEISLSNKGAFVAHIRVHAVHSNGSSATYNLSSNIAQGNEKTLDLANTGSCVNDGDIVWLEAVVAGGKNNEATQAFIYNKTSNYTAKYRISGTTLNNSLAYNGLAIIVPPTNSTPIKAISLKNDGAFVSRIKIHARHTDGSISLFEWSKDITVGFEQNLDLSKTNNAVKDGDIVWLEAVVKAGKNNEAKQSFIYDDSSDKKATYNIKGTTLSNTLTFSGIGNLIPELASEKIRLFSLKNSGGFVARIIAHIRHKDGTTDAINADENITLGFEKVLDLSKLSAISTGDTVWLEAEVVGGKNKIATEAFTFEKRPCLMAKYTIKGTTLINTLSFDKVIIATPGTPKLNTLKCCKIQSIVYGSVTEGICTDELIVRRTKYVSGTANSYTDQKGIQVDGNGAFADVNVEPNVQYGYKVYAKNYAEKKSDNSNEIKIKCQGSAPDAPSAPSLQLGTDGLVTITSGISAGATGYKFYRGSSSSPFATSGSNDYIDNFPTTNAINTYYVSAFNAFGESKKSPASSLFVHKKRKALCIATSANVRSPNGCLQMAKAFQRNGIHAEVLLDVEKKDFDAKVVDYFKDFNEDDTPIIMLSAHGNINYVELLKSGDAYVGLSFDELKKTLDKIHGHKILFVSSCHSGSAVNAFKSDSQEEANTDVKKLIPAKFDMQLMKQTINSIFNIKKQTRSKTQSNYSILCASQENENSFGVGVSDIKQLINYVTRWWCLGLGWDIKSGSATSNVICSQKADSDKNKVVTVKELAAFAYNEEQSRLGNSKSAPFCYPEDDDTVIVSY